MPPRIIQGFYFNTYLISRFSISTQKIQNKARNDFQLRRFKKAIRLDNNIKLK
jgi:hypothetical protein